MSKNKLPGHLYDAFDWINSASELLELEAMEEIWDARLYARDCAANWQEHAIREHWSAPVTADLVMELWAWLREGKVRR